jgi:hypothetical protein
MKYETIFLYEERIKSDKVEERPMRENEFSRKMFMYAKGYHDIKANKDNIFMPRGFSFVIIRIERGARTRWGARTE